MYHKKSLNKLFCNKKMPTCAELIEILTDNQIKDIPTTSNQNLLIG